MVLEVKQLTKKYDQIVFAKLNFQLLPQTIYGLLGRNGAGKSTLMKIMANQEFPSSGQVLLDNRNVTNNNAALKKVFLMGNEDLYPSNYTLNKMWRISQNFAPAFDRDFALTLSQRFHLSPENKLKKLSTGYRTIAKMITALCMPSDYIFLDEPIIGVDAPNRELLYQAIIETYSHNPRTFVIATHIIEETSPIFERVMILDQGKIIVQGSVEDLLPQMKRISGPRDEIAELIRNRQVYSLQKLGNLTTAYVKDLPTENLPQDINYQNVDLQTYFIQLTKGGNNEPSITN